MCLECLSQTLDLEPAPPDMMSLLFAVPYARRIADQSHAAGWRPHLWQGCHLSQIALLGRKLQHGTWFCLFHRWLVGVFIVFGHIVGKVEDKLLCLVFGRPVDFGKTTFVQRFRVPKHRLQLASCEDEVSPTCDVVVALLDLPKSREGQATQSVPQFREPLRHAPCAMSTNKMLCAGFCPTPAVRGSKKMCRWRPLCGLVCLTCVFVGLCDVTSYCFV